MSTRHDLKKNELADMVLIAVEWIRNNRNTFFSILAIAAGVLLFSVFFFTRLQTMKVRAEDKLSMAMGQLQQGAAPQGLATLDEIINSYGGTVAASRARLFKADYLISQNKFKEAEQAVQPVISAGKPKEVVPLAYETLGVIQEDEGNFTDALKTYTTFLEKYPEHFLTPKIYESIGRIRELTGAPQEARSMYEKLATLYPGTAWAQRAQEKMRTLPSAPAAALPGLPSAGK
jgi:TolA-binding protein